MYALPLQLMEYARATVGGFTSVLLPRLTELTTRGDLGLSARGVFERHPDCLLSDRLARRRR